MMNPRYLLPLVLLILVGCDSLGDYFTTERQPEMERVELSSLPLVQYDTLFGNPFLPDEDPYVRRTYFLRPDLSGPYTGPVVHSVVDEVTGYRVVREWGQLLEGQRDGWWLIHDEGEDPRWGYFTNGSDCGLPVSPDDESLYELIVSGMGDTTLTTDLPVDDSLYREIVSGSVEEGCRGRGFPPLYLPFEGPPQPSIPPGIR